MKKKMIWIAVLVAVLVLLAAAAFILKAVKDGNCQHIYQSFTQADDDNHKGVCTLCNKEHTLQHTWDEGTVTQEATCKRGGRVTYTCTGCGAEKTEDTLALTEHAYDNNCDVECNVCGAVRQTNHTTSDVWGKDAVSHWKECAECGKTLEKADHIPGPAATEAAAQVCTDCGYIIQPELGHVHNYATTWTTDKVSHWYACSGCEEKKELGQHIYDNDCDSDCNTCGYTRQNDHVYRETWSTDGSGHWYGCIRCEDKKDFGSHTYDCEFDDKCNTCNYSRGIMNFEKYSNLSGAEQQAFFESFANPQDFFDWLNAAKEYDRQNSDDIIIGGDGVIDLGDLLGGKN